jgi:hypothetical protein
MVRHSRRRKNHRQLRRRLVSTLNTHRSRPNKTNEKQPGPIAGSGRAFAG